MDCIAVGTVRITASSLEEYASHHGTCAKENKVARVREELQLRVRDHLGEGLSAETLASFYQQPANRSLSASRIFHHRYDDLFGAQIFDLIAAVYETNANVVTSITRIADDLHLHETSRSDYAEGN